MDDSFDDLRADFLIIDDDEAFANSLAETLAAKLDEGVASAVANSAESAMAIFDQLNPRAIILDMHLGSANGMTLMNELASYNDTLATPKVILSSSGGKIKLDDVAGFGVVTVYDKKTYEIDELTQTLKQIIAQQRGDELECKSGEWKGNGDNQFNNASNNSQAD